MAFTLDIYNAFNTTNQNDSIKKLCGNYNRKS